MKSARLIFACLVVTVLAVWVGNAWAVNYVNLVQGTEKWFESDGTEKGIPYKMRTIVGGYHDGAPIMRRFITRGNATMNVEYLVFSATPAGDVYFHGDLREEVFAQPVLWVDVPLDVGKTWTASRPDDRSPKDSIPMVHYVFTVLDRKEIACPAGTFKCAQVFVAEIAPDGAVKNSTFWYNNECGLIMCALENQPRFKLTKTFVNGPDGDPPHREEIFPQGKLSGLITSPNPAKPTAHISFALQEPAQVEVGVYDIAGRLIKRLVAQEYRAAGPVSVYWPGTDESGRRAASGTYILRVQADQIVRSDRITLVR